MKNSNDQKKVLTVDELKDYLNIGRRTAYELVNTKGFPSFRIGAKVLVSVPRLEKWIEEQIEKGWENE